MKTSFGTFCLQRYPLIKNQNLRAWDAADEYLLHDLQNQKPTLNQNKILIFNDAFGALSIALSSFIPTVITDSYISKSSIINNLENNNKHQTSINILSSLDDLTENYNYVLIKMPKSLDYLLYFLDKLSTHIVENTVIIVAGMVKHLPKTTWDVLQKNLGSTETSLTVKKAKLIRVKFEKKTIKNNYPQFFIQENTPYKIYNHANVFSKKTLDIGTRFLLQNLPQFEKIESIIDLGCGNGIVGLNLIHKYPQAQVMFTDESYMAIESARLTVSHNNIDVNNHVFKINNCLDDIAINTADLIVCNPPFHESQNIGIQIALKMFQQSYSILKAKGYFIVIANRHLPYFAHLKRIFKKVENVASNRKFSIYLMQKN